ncbi:hypothetical protein Q7C_501 [Methylophaga frappieri]|uniref:Cadherin domain-containing protein n=2 Tax=Methylophaga frappieri (strain ATCC BAA-2434 / DSM 25690 / JAM7) TaxID=754477 RepID=I1YFI1_METFJ|nr:hypothetical protein Q7C_501 [Methylophaga frappieri]
MVIGNMSQQKGFNSIFKSKTQRLALEPRIVFDAALPIAIAEQADNANHTESPTSAEPHQNSENQGDFSPEFSAESSTGRQIVFIDAGIENQQSIANQFANSEVILLNGEQDGLLQIAEAVAGRNDIEAIHLFSHGSDGQLQLGNSTVNEVTLTQDYSEALSQIRAVLSVDADILLYGCDVAGSAEGQSFVAALAAATGADIAASTDLTGAKALGGDWDLEWQAGAIESQVVEVSGFTGLLGAPEITDAQAVDTRSTDEDVPLTITGISVTDDDAGVELQVAISVTGGSITLAGAGWAVTAGADGTSAVTITGTEAEINSALNGMVFTPVTNSNSLDPAYTPLIDITVNDVDTPDGPTNIQISNINVVAINDAPTISGGTPLEVNEGGTSSFSAATAASFGFTQAQLGLSDIDNQAVQTIIKIAAVPANGDLRLNGNLIAVGSTFAASDINNLSYQHNGSQVTSVTTDTFLITVDDGAGGLITNQSVSVNINPINQAPTLEGSITVIEGETAVNLADNGLLIAPFNSSRGAISFFDPEGGTAQNYEITSLPINGTLFYNGVAIVAASVGTPFVVADPGLLTYSHSGGENSTDSFNMQVQDDGGGEGNVLSDSATIQLNIVPNNDDPVLNTNVAQTMAPGSTSITLTPAMLEVTDVDSANTSLTYTLTSVPNPAEGYFTVNGQTLTVGATFTQADINAGNVTFVTLSDTPRTDSMTFTVKDGGIRLFPDSRDGGIYDNPSQGSPLTPITFDVVVPDTVTVSPDPVPGAADINTPPTSGGTNTIDAADLNEGGTFNFSNTELLITDAESSPDELVYRLVSLPTSGLIRLNGAELTYNQTFTQADINNGNVSFVHSGDEDFVDSFSYTISDGNTESAPQSFSIAATPQNDTPEAVNNSAIFVGENNTVVINGANIVLSDRDNSASDNETGNAVNDELSFRITVDTLHGELRLDGVLITANTTIVTLAQLQNGDLTYTHLGSENFSDSFSLVPLDDSGVVVPTATNASSEGSTLIVPITIFPANDATTFVSKRQLIAGEAGAVVEGGSRVIGGAQSYATINGVSGSGLPTPDPNLSNAHLVFGDDDNSSIQRQYRITDATNNGSLFLNTTALGVGSVFTQDDLDSGRISYQHDGTETSNDSFDYVVSDGDWTSNDSVSVAQGLPSPPGSTFLIEITPTNDIAEISGPDNLDVFAAGAATTAVPVITLADLDLDDGITAGETDFMRIEVSVVGTGANLLNYTAADPSSFVSGKGTDVMILQGTKAEIDAVLASLTIAFSADLDDDNLILRVVADDRLYDNSGSLLANANGGPVNDDGSAINAANNRVTHDITLRVSNSNDVPVITNVSGFTVDEDAEITLGGFALSDADSFDEDVTATIELFNDAGRTTLASSANEGRLRLSSQPDVVITGNNSNTITITGNITDVENALNALRFQGRGDFNGPGLGNGTLYLRSTIADFDHAGGQQTATVDNDITITPVNDAPVLAINATLTNGLSLDSGTSININAEGGSFTLNDNRDTSEGAADLISVSVAATNTVGGASYGTLTATTSGGAIISNDNTATITITGTAADVEATLNSLVYTPTDANVDTVVRIRTTADDRDGGVGNGTEGVGVDGNNTDSEDFFIEVSGTNDAPVITLPVNPTVLEDSTANAISGISISDTDDFGSDLQVSLSLAGTPKGTINLSTIAGLTFSTGDGTNDTAMVFTGTKAAINTALASLTFTPTGDQNTVAFTQDLTVNVDDQGNTGTGGALTDSETLQITITPVNDAPLRTAASTSLPAVPEDTANPVGDTVSNIFGPRFDDSTDTVTNGSTANTLAGVAIVDNAATAAQGVWQYNSGGGWLAIPATASLANPFLLSSTDQVRFLAQPDWNGTPGDLTVRLIDSSSGAVATGAGADLSGGATGDTTAFSNAANAVTLGTAITAVNDAPVASGSGTLASINEDNTNPAGAALSSVITSSQYDDSTDTVAGGSSATALGGIAIIGNAANPATEGSWQYNSGSGWVTITNVGLSSGNALVLPATADIRFLPVAEYSGTPGALTVHLADSVQAEASGQDISGNLGTTETWSADSINIATAVNPVNDTPVVSGVATTHTYIENDPALVLEPALSLADVDDADLNQAVITIASGFSAGDTLALDAALATSLGLTVDSSVPGTLTISGNATKAEYQSLLRTVNYSSSSDNPGSADRTINWTVRDENSEAAANGQQTSTVVNTTVEVTPVNDAPVITLPANPTVLEDSTANAIGISIADADDSGSDLQVSLSLAGTPKGTINLSTIAGLTFSTGDGTNDTAMVFTGTKAAINTALASLTFTPTGDQNTVAFTQDLTVNVDDQGNTGTGGALTDSETLQITITPVNDAPLRTAASTSLPAVPEDTANPVGDTVSNIFGPRFDDSTDTVTNGSTANTLAGVAIVDNAATAAQGVWQYNSGGGW